jgi:DNA helicase-2/ATP-dependent DNA helicase PcrA
MSNAVIKSWSPAQLRVFDWIENGSGNAIIKAVAGSGKTTTIVEAGKRIPAGKRVLYLAFNVSIAAELKGRIAAGHEAKTFHSLGYGALFFYARDRKLTLGQPSSRKTSTMLEILTRWEDGAQAKQMRMRHDNKAASALRASNYMVEQRITEGAGLAIVKLVSLAKQYGLGISSIGAQPNTPDAWFTLADNFDIEADKEGVTQDEIIGVARNLFELSTDWFKSAGQLDFDDQLYLPLLFGLKIKKYDWVFLDEAQDTNPVRRALATRALAPQGRLGAVGDQHQAIYGFTGANADALDLIRDQFNCVELPLTVSYRCPRLVVEAAREFVSHIEAAPGAADGAVTRLNEMNLGQVKNGDAILARLNAPLVSNAYKLITAGRGARILGRDIASGLLKLIDKMNAKNLEQLIAKLDVWAQREADAANEKGNETKAQAIGDRAACIVSVIEQLPEGRRSITDLKNTLDRMFTDETLERDAEGKLLPSKLVTFSTVHKAKGKEWPRVVIIDRQSMPSKMARKPWELDQENNLLYVAYTRAQQELVIVNERALKS